MARSVRNGLFAFIGIALVVIGALLLTDRLIAPVLRPLAAVVHTLGLIAWPLALIGVGVVLITASRHTNSGGRLYRSRTDRVISGVLGGFAARWGMSANVVRVLFVVLAILTNGFAALVLYILATAFIAEEPSATLGDATIPPAPPVPPVPYAAPAPTAPPVPESTSTPVVP